MNSYLDWYADGADYYEVSPHKKWSPYFILALIALLLIMWR